MANSELKLYYLDGKGLAEVARLILAAAGKKFEDIRYSYDDWHSTYKLKAPFSKCPMLEIDGQIFAQSLAINAFLAREFGFHGKTHMEALAIDQVANLVQDLTRICVVTMYTKDKEELKASAESIKKEKSPTFLSYFEKLLKENDTGYFVSNRITLADISVFDMATGMLEPYVNIDGNYPLLQKNIETVRAHARIGPYVASRPKSEF